MFYILFAICVVIQSQSALCQSLESVVDDGIDDDHRYSMVTVDVLVIVLTLVLFGTAAGAAIRIDSVMVPVLIADVISDANDSSVAGSVPGVS